MDITEYELVGKNSKLLNTEILFHITSAKVLGKTLLRLGVKEVFDGTREERRVKSITDILKSLKRRGLIQLFVFSSELKNSSTETEYLENVYPEIKNINTDERFFIIKL